MGVRRPEAGVEFAELGGAACAAVEERRAHARLRQQPQPHLRPIPHPIPNPSAHDPHTHTHTHTHTRTSESARVQSIHTRTWRVSVDCEACTV
eukprot:2342682-Rhodomonas_salina.2